MTDIDQETLTFERDRAILTANKLQEEMQTLRIVLAETQSELRNAWKEIEEMKQKAMLSTGFTSVTIGPDGHYEKG